MRIEIALQGITPLICNRFGDKPADDATNGVRGSSAAVERGSPQDICEGKLYKGLDGRPMVPQPNVLRCLVDGGRYHKVGKTQLTTSRGSQLYSCVDIEGAEIPILSKQRWTVDTRAVRIPATGGRILCHRPMFNDWRLELVGVLDETQLRESLFRQIVDDAGNRIGLGDFRPATKGPYGRFRVDSWVVAETNGERELAIAAD
jgi:hypothetical protein